MTLREIKDLLQAEILTGEELLDIEPTSICGAILSDVLAFTKEKSLLLTGLTNSQVIGQLK